MGSYHLDNIRSGQRETASHVTIQSKHPWPDASEHLGLVRHIVKTFPRGSVLSADDMFQEGCVGLMAACKFFDPTRGVPFASYAVPCIRGAICTALEKWHRNSTPTPKSDEPFVSISRRVIDDPDYAPVLGLHRRDDSRNSEHVADPGADADLADAESLDTVRRLLAQLPKQWREIMELRLGLHDGPMTYEQIGRLLGKTKQRIHQIVQDARQKLTGILRREQELEECAA